jgi:hypothetical protein
MGLGLASLGRCFDSNPECRLSLAGNKSTCSTLLPPINLFRYGERKTKRAATLGDSRNPNARESAAVF